MPGLQHTAHGGDGGAPGGACISSSGSTAVGGGISKAPALLCGSWCRLREAGGGDRDERSAARDSGSKHGGGRPQRRGVVCAPLWRDAERTRAFAFVHAGRGGGAGAAGAGVSQG